MTTDAAFWAAVWSGSLAGVIGGVVVGIVAGLVREGIEFRRAKRRRRTRVVSSLARARALIFQAINNGVYDDFYLERDKEPFRRFQDKYQDLTIEALDLFVPGEEDEAFWTAVEFHSGLVDPMRFLRETAAVPSPEGFPLLVHEGLGGVTPQGAEVTGFQLPRPGMLVEWADLRGEGPFYGDLVSGVDGDSVRHNVIFPNTDVNTDLLLPPVWDVYKSREMLEPPKGLAKLFRRWTRAGRSEPKRTFRDRGEQLRERKQREREWRKEERALKRERK